MKTKNFQTKSTFRFFLATFAVLSFLIMPGWLITSARADEIPYDASEVQKIKSFLESKSMTIGKTNADLLGVDMNNPDTWGFAWISKIGVTTLPARHATDIRFKCNYLAGSLDISDFPYLGYFELDCFATASSNFDQITISNNPDLRWGVVLHSVKVNELRITKNEYLTSVRLSGKVDLLTFDQPDLYRLETNTLGNIPPSFSQFPKLHVLVLSGCENLANLDLASLPALEELSLSNTSISNLNVAVSPSLKGLSLVNMPTLETINLKKDIGGLYIEKTGLKEINLDGLNDLISFQCINNRAITSLKVSDKPSIEGGVTMSISGNSALRFLELSNLPTQKYLTITDNEMLEQIVLKGLPQLKEMKCVRNGLTSLDVSGLPSLVSLSAFDNQLTKFNTTGRVFEQLGLLWGNKLTEVTANVGGHHIHLKAYGKGGYVNLDAGPSYWLPYGIQIAANELAAPYNTILEKVEGTGFPPKENDYEGGFLLDKDVDATFYFKADIHFLNYFGDLEGDLPDEDEGEYDSDANLNYQSRVGEPFKLPEEYPLPSKTGFEIQGWYTDSTFTHEWIAGKDTLRGELILYPKWLPTGMPVVLSVKRQSPTDENTSANHVTYLVTFSTTVSGVDVSDFVLTTMGTVSGKIASVSAANGNTISVEVNNIAGTGTLRLDVKSTETGIADAESNPLAGGYTSGEIYNIGNPTAIADAFQAEKVCRIFPNPTSGTIRIDTPENEPIDRVEIFSIQGKRVLVIDQLQDNNLDLNGFPRGIYVVKIQSKTGIYNNKVIVSR